MGGGRWLGRGGIDDGPDGGGGMGGSSPLPPPPPPWLDFEPPFCFFILMSKREREKDNDTKLLQKTELNTALLAQIH